MPNPLNPDAFPKYYRVKVSRERGLTLGVIRCKHCRLPPNNHFDFPPYTCAHRTCPGYEEVCTL